MRHAGWWRIAVLALMACVTVWALGWSVPEPSPWMNSWGMTFLKHAAPILYWELFFTHIVYWSILRLQRRPSETGAAKWLRVFMLSKAFLWFALAAGRTILQDWMIVGYTVVTIYVAIASTSALIALVWTYVIPAWRGHERPPSDEGVLPMPVTVERRIGPPDRRSESQA